MDLAPIILFVYNRPVHTLRTLKALKNNDLADQSVLYIYADGLRLDASANDIKNLANTRDLIKKENWCKEVHINESQTNIGLADSIIQGVTEIINLHGKVIVLEDDIETSKGFLKYMNEALVAYENEDQVMHISGYMFPLKSKLPPTFFFNSASCWGWGTWKESWSKFVPDPNYINQHLSSRNLYYEFDLGGSLDYTNQLIANCNGDLKTWAVKWHGSIFMNGGFCLHPYPSLTQNIGNDGSGINSATTDKFVWKKLASEICVTPIPLVENLRARQAVKKFTLDNTVQSKGTFLNSCGVNLKAAIKFFLVRKFRDDKIAQSRTEKELNRIRKMEGDSLIESKIFGENLLIPDAANFLTSYRKIVMKEAYEFTAATPNPNIIDANAGIGIGIIYFKKLYPDARILAFEPDPELFKILKTNVENFNFTDVLLENKDLSYPLQFLDETVSESSNLHSAIPPMSISESTTNPQIDFLKLRIENEDVAVIEELKTHMDKIKNLLIEFRSVNNKQQMLSIILQTLEQENFRYYMNSDGLSINQPFRADFKYYGPDMGIDIYARQLIKQ